MNALADAKSLFANALDRPPEGRGAYLDAACGGDAGLRAEVADLLAAHDRAGGFLSGRGRDEATHADAAAAEHTPLDGRPGADEATRVVDGPPAAPGARPMPAAPGGYRVERLLGEGGMGVVFLARDDRLDRPVALKMMRAEVAARPGARDRFLREARAAARVSHPNVVPILHVGEDAGAPYIAMPLLEGESLDRLLARGPVPLGVVLKVGREAADGLAAAHAKGLIHRDVKPANLWLEGEPEAADWAARLRRVKVLDFGLARPAEDDAHLTGTGAVLGTPAYMSPEQARGGPVDARTDLFSLGVVLYRMTTGELPFPGTTAMAVLTALAADTPPPPAVRNPRVPAALSDLVVRLLAKDRAERPAAAEEVAGLLRSIGRQQAAARKAAAIRTPAPAAPPDSGTHPVLLDAGSGSPDPAGATEQEAPPAPAVTAVRPPERPRPVRAKRGPGQWVLVGFAALLVATLAGTVVIKIKNSSGPATELRVPDGSTVAVGANGEVEVTLPPAPKDGPKPAPADGRTPDRRGAEWALGVGAAVRVDGGERDVRTAADLPKGDFRLTRVDAANCEKATDAGLAALRDCTGLTVLNLCFTPIGDAGLEHLKGLTSLDTLLLEGTRATAAGLAHLGGLAALHELSLGGLAAGDGLKHLGGLKGLRVLNLNGATVGDAGAKHLAALTGLRSLHLCGGDVTAAGVAHLKGLKDLQLLELSGQPVGDAGLKHLEGMTSLGVVRVERTGATAAGVAALKKALPGREIVSDPPGE